MARFPNSVDIGLRRDGDWLRPVGDGPIDTASKIRWQRRCLVHDICACAWRHHDKGK
jgi:hypothetical protein